MSAEGSDLFAGVVPFVAVAREGRFRGAARTLGLTPSAISKAISRLEGDLGVQLLRRTSRSVTLTPEGESFLRGCEQAVTSVHDARERVAHAQSAPRGRLVVSLPRMLGRVLIVPALPRLLSMHPALSVRALLTDRFVQLSDEGVDVALRIGETPESRLRRRKLGMVRWATVASPAYLARRGRPETPGDLERHNCLQFELPNGIARDWDFVADGAPVTVRARGDLVADDGDALVAAAIAGLGLFQAHDYIVAPALASGALIEVLADFAAPGPPIAALLPPSRISPKVRAFLDFASELLAASRS